MLPWRIFSRPLAHRVGLTLTQHTVDDKTNASPVVMDVPRNVVLEGRVVTMDTLRTQRTMAQGIVEAGRAYVMPVKDNPPQLLQDIPTVFAPPPTIGETRTAAATVDDGQGRVAPQ